MNRYRATLILAPALVLGLLFFSCKKKAEDPPRQAKPALSADVKVVATVNNDPITLAEFQERFLRAGYRPEQEAERAVKEEFLNRLIERKMILREAQRRRIKVGLPEIHKRIAALQQEHGEDIKEVLASQGIDFEKWKSDVWEDLMIEHLLARDVNRNVGVSSSEVKRYYQENTQEFEKPEQVRARQIVVLTEGEAQRVLESLQPKDADFAAVAKQKSTAPEAENGGDLGYFAMGDMPAEFNVVFGLPKGAMSGIVKSPYGYHIFKLEDRRKAGKLALDTVSKSIAEKIKHGKEDAHYKKWLQELRARTKFEVNYQALISP